MACNNCGSNCECDPANIRIPIGPRGPIGPMGPAGPQGNPGEDGNGITSASYDSNTGIVTITFDDGTTFDTGDLRGEDGADGNPSSDLSSDVVNDLTSTTYSTYNDFRNSDLAQMRDAVHPLGIISAFSLSASNFDSNGYGIDLSGSGGSNLLGWAICNGNTYQKSVGAGTLASPDLRGRFLVGVDENDVDGDFALGDQGGSKNHTHDAITLTKDNLPEHEHDLGSVAIDDHTHSAGTLEAEDSADSKHTHIIDSFRDSGGSGANWVERTHNSNASSPQNFTTGDDRGNISDGEHTHNITGSTGNIDSAGTIGLDSDTGGIVSATPGQAFDTTEATNTAAESNALPPYYSLIYLVKI